MKNLGGGGGGYLVYSAISVSTKKSVTEKDEYLVCLRRSYTDVCLKGLLLVS